MARSTNFLLKNTSGSIAKQLVIKQYGDRTVLASFPDFSRRRLSDKQIDNHKLMKEANRYARTIMGDIETRDKALLRLNITRNKLYTSLIKEYFQAKKQVPENGL